MRDAIADAAPAPARTPRHRAAETGGPALAFDDEPSGRRERIGWVRGTIASLVVALATALVIGGCALLVRSVDPVTSAASPGSSPSAPAAEPAPVAPVAPAAPVAATEAPAPAPPPAPAETPAPVPATGRAADGDRSVSFVVSQAQLRAGRGVSITVSATGPDTDRVQQISITTADGAPLSAGSADGCTGPAYPWSQTFAITFPQAESTELRVQLTSCTGTVLTATSLVDVQP